ncbi:heme peroxidase, plant/fungal/bacterial [Corchorus capsularis]|uniref:peroxidase n=1 Tax=Corchorus capsularis TaxID=210143 RepID=A0A1R3G6Q7_COCAP|nr:heme peroxidase, plant/fungal/bacterial [Corchorus capsularis]
MKSGFNIFLVVSLVLFGIVEVCNAGLVTRSGLRYNYYKKSCRPAETIVQNIIRDRVRANPGLAAKLIRLHFHDCFVRFKKPLWDVPLGRRDGRVSLATEINGNIPGPFQNFSSLLQNFNKKGLTVDDLVILSGAHTIGVSHCGVFSRRLYNFTGKGDADPSLDKDYADILRKQCPNPASPTITVDMDPGSALSFDPHYYEILLQNKGLFTSDAELLTDRYSRRKVIQLQRPRAFFPSFAASMVKMGAIEVLTGNAGEIRQNCRVVNP